MRIPSLPILLAAALAVPALPAIASSQGVTCGQVLKASATLTSDLVCSGSAAALVIGADGVTLDLNGHTISGTGAVGSVGVDNIGGFDDITIKNGVIANFDWCIRALHANRLTIENVRVEAAGWTYIAPGFGWGAIGIQADHGTGLTIENVSVTNAVFGVYCVSVRGARIEKVGVRDCFVGVNISSCSFGSPIPGSCPHSPPAPPTSGILEECDVTSCDVGLWIEATDDFAVGSSSFNRCLFGVRIGLSGVELSNVRITDCQLRMNAQFGILALVVPAGPGLPLPIHDLLLADNDVSQNLRGIALVNCQDSRIAGNQASHNDQFGMTLFEQSARNTVTGNTCNSNGWWGIGLAPDLTMPSRQGPFGNQIVGNTALHNRVFDLFHSPTSRPNAWRDNVYKTGAGADL